jgi:hypothetical protein
LVEYMLGVLRDEGERTKTRVEAASWLADRGFGRPQQTTLVGTADEQATPSPYEGMTAEQLWARLRAFLTDEPAGYPQLSPPPKRSGDRAGPSPAKNISSASSNAFRPNPERTLTGHPAAPATGEMRPGTRNPYVFLTNCLRRERLNAA